MDTRDERAVSKLPPDERKVIRKVMWQLENHGGVDPVTIASDLKVTEAEVCRRHTRALLHMFKNPDERDTAP